MRECVWVEEKEGVCDRAHVRVFHLCNQIDTPFLKPDSLAPEGRSHAKQSWLQHFRVR